MPLSLSHVTFVMSTGFPESITKEQKVLTQILSSWLNATSALI